MLEQTSLSEQRTGKDRQYDQRDRWRELKHGILQGDGWKHESAEEQIERDPSIEAAIRHRHVQIVEPAVEALEQSAHPHDGMPEPVEQGFRIAEPRLDQKRAEDGDGVER